MKVIIRTLTLLNLFLNDNEIYENLEKNVIFFAFLPLKSNFSLTSMQRVTVSRSLPTKLEVFQDS